MSFIFLCLNYRTIVIYHFSRVMRCSLNVLPQTKELLHKCRLPLGILIHPFKDLEVN